MNLTLTTDEARMLRDLLTDLLRDLRREVARTDAKEFRHELVLRQEVVERLLAQIDREAASGQPAAAHVGR